MKQTTKCMELSLRQQGDTEFWNSIGLKMPRILYSWAHLFLEEVIPIFQNSDLKNDETKIKLINNIDVILDLIEQSGNSHFYTLGLKLRSSIQNTFASTVCQNGWNHHSVSEYDKISDYRTEFLNNLKEINRDAINSIPDPPKIESN